MAAGRRGRRQELESKFDSPLEYARPVGGEGGCYLAKGRRDQRRTGSQVATATRSREGRMIQRIEGLEPQNQRQSFVQRERPAHSAIQLEIARPAISKSSGIAKSAICVLRKCRGINPRPVAPGTGLSNLLMGVYAIWIDHIRAVVPSIGK